MSDFDDISPAELERLSAEFAAESARIERERSALPGLDKYFVEWDTITADLVDEFRQEVADADTEHDTQRFLQTHPELLLQPLGGGHGRWVIPQKDFGGRFRSDFMIADQSSLGFEWTAVELEGPQQRVFNKDGSPAHYLRKAIDQIEEWRLYIRENLQSCRRPRHEMGLGLVDIDASVPGWVIIGRGQLQEETRMHRRQLGSRHNIEIHTYDWLVDQAARRVAELKHYRDSSAD